MDYEHDDRRAADVPGATGAEGSGLPAESEPAASGPADDLFDGMFLTGGAMRPSAFAAVDHDLGFPPPQAPDLASAFLAALDAIDDRRFVTPVPDEPIMPSALVAPVTPMVETAAHGEPAYELQPQSRLELESEDTSESVDETPAEPLVAEDVARLPWDTGRISVAGLLTTGEISAGASEEVQGVQDVQSVQDVEEVASVESVDDAEPVEEAAYYAAGTDGDAGDDDEAEAAAAMAAEAEADADAVVAAATQADADAEAAAAAADAEALAEAEALALALAEAEAQVAAEQAELEAAIAAEAALDEAPIAEALIDEAAIDEALIDETLIADASIDQVSMDQASSDDAASDDAASDDAAIIEASIAEAASDAFEPSHSTADTMAFDTSIAASSGASIDDDVFGAVFDLAVLDATSDATPVPAFGAGLMPGDNDTPGDDDIEPSIGMEPMDAAPMAFDGPDAFAPAPVVAAVPEPEPESDELEDLQDFVVFSLGDMRCVVPIRNVVEVGRIPDAAPVPNAPVWLYGLGNLRGQVLSLIDLRALFGVGRIKPSAGRMVVLRGDEDDITAGVMVDQVHQIVALSPARFKEAPASLSLPANSSEYVRGACDYGNYTMINLDVDGVLGVESLTEEAV